MREREREIGREKERERETDKETERQRGREKVSEREGDIVGAPSHCPSLGQPVGGKERTARGEGGRGSSDNATQRWQRWATNDIVRKRRESENR